jgi:Flp pilus assembly pilin Flp
MLTFSEWFDLVRASCKREEGQTMAEYAVVLAAITIATVLVFQTLSGGIQGTLNKVIALLP